MQSPLLHPVRCPQPPCLLFTHLCGSPSACALSCGSSLWTVRDSGVGHCSWCAYPEARSSHLWPVGDYSHLNTFSFWQTVRMWFMWFLRWWSRKIKQPSDLVVVTALTTGSSYCFFSPLLYSGPSLLSLGITLLNKHCLGNPEVI